MKINCAAILAAIIALASSDAAACTTAVVSGRATADGRPLLWKNRDTWQQQNEVIFDDRGKYSFVGVVNAEASQLVWMGANEAGLCIENSLSRDLDDDSSRGPGNGSFIRAALQNCATVADFEDLLITTNQTGRRTNGNFGVIDARGGAMMFEVGSQSYQRFNANDPLTAPRGFIVRANASISGMTGGDQADNSKDDILRSVYSSNRYRRAVDLCSNRAAKKLDVRFLLQNVARDIAGIDFSKLVDPRPVNTSRTLNRNTTVSAVVFHGVLPGEPPECTTMWTLLGEPIFSAAVPTWVAQQQIAHQLNGEGRSPLCDLSTRLRKRHYQQRAERRREQLLPNHVGSIDSRLREIEDDMIVQTLSSLEAWRNDPPMSSQLWRLHRDAAGQSVQRLDQLCQVITPALDPESPESRIHIDFRFADPDGTRLGDAVDSAGSATWDGGIADTKTQNGRLRIRRHKSDPVNRYVDLTPDVRVKSHEGAPHAHLGWLVVEMSGWDLRGQTLGEIVRVGFTSRPAGHRHVAGLQLKRTAASEVTVDGVAFGTGGEPIQVAKRWPAHQPTPVTFVVELDKITANNGEGAAGGIYRLFYKTADAATYTPLGQPAPVRRLRNGNQLHLHVEGPVGEVGEFVDIDRIYFTTTDPMRTEK